MSQKLNPTDAFFLQVERPAAPMHIASLVRLQIPTGGDADYVHHLMQSIRQVPITAAPFNYKLVEGPLGRWTPAWEIDDDIDIDYHLRHSALPRPGSERELAVLISRLHSIPLDRARPLWEMHLIEGLSHNQFAVYMKIHHALVDGMASVRLMNRTLATKPAPDAFVPMWGLSPSQSKTKGSAERDLTGRREALAAMANQFGQRLNGAGRVAGALGRIIRGHRNTDLPHLVAPYSAPDCVLNGAIGPQRRVSTQDFALADIRALAKNAKATLNDMVMALCAGGLRHYLGELQALPSEPLIAQVPVSVRAGDDAGGGNAISMLLTNLGTHLADPRRRFDCIKASLDDGKALLKRLSKNDIDQYSALLMAPFAIGQVAGIGNRARKPMFNLVISNVPGPKTPLYLNEAEVHSVHPVSLVFEGQALNITIFSYADKLSFVYTACRSSLPHIQNIVGHTQAALEELCDVFDLKPVKRMGAKAASKAPAKAQPRPKPKPKTKSAAATPARNKAPAKAATTSAASAKPARSRRKRAT